jgi:hypothetical protein
VPAVVSHYPARHHRGGRNEHARPDGYWRACRPTGGHVREAGRLMDEAHVKVLPVCEGDRLMGVLTDSDVISAIADGGAPDTEFVRDYMSTNVVAVTPDTGLADAGQLMAHGLIHHPVVCDDDRCLGIVHVDVEWSELGGLAPPHATFAATV